MKINIELPRTANDIPLWQYQNFLQIEEPTENDILSVFAGLSDKAIDNIPLKELSKITAHLVSLFGSNELQCTFVLNGKTFGFIPKLDDISWGENQDVTKYLPNESNKGKDFHRAMAVLYRPITYKKGDHYLIEKYEGSDKYAEELKDMPLGVALGSISFFFLLSKDLLRAIPNFIQREAEKQTLSLEDGEHITKLIHSLKVTFEGLTKLQNLDYTPAL